MRHPALALVPLPLPSALGPPACSTHLTIAHSHSHCQPCARAPATRGRSVRRGGTPDYGTPKMWSRADDEGRACVCPRQIFIMMPIYNATQTRSVPTRSSHARIPIYTCSRLRDSFIRLTQHTYQPAPGEANNINVACLLADEKGSATDEEEILIRYVYCKLIVRIRIVRYRQRVPSHGAPSTDALCDSAASTHFSRRAMVRARARDVARKAKRLVSATRLRRRYLPLAW
ncbi:hypothetical protein C8F04DRAFT_1236334 [Mycena alexandri]|uniref:Uncharacterized protein n=1 Tax=Mycena alexandri TaxID=1745969 RepID=A0AAD6WZB5_9AGAR|nr:hypothetical protein C8F04DRAFT_1236334 [Mycena alexandri]